MENELKLCLISSPKINILRDSNYEKIKIKEGEIIYVGEAKSLSSRINQHQSDQLSGAGGMKF